MKIQGEYELPASRERVWEALQDPQILSRTLPGCEQLERVGENSFRGALNVAIGPVRGEFKGTLQLSNLLPPESYHMKLDGQGPSGFMKGEGDIRLQAAGPSSTTLAYDIEAQVGGRIAGVGQRLLDSSAKVITQQGLEGLARQLEATSTGDGESSAESVAAPTQAQFAAKVARGVADDLVPGKWRAPLVVGAAIAVAAVLFLLLRACG